MKYSILFVVITIILVMPSCTATENTGQTVSNYDMTKPEKFFMPESLQEISGIAFHKQNSDTIYAIQDEEGKLFRLAWDEKKQYHSKFGKKGDYEDLSVLKEQVIVLKSNGSLYSFPFSDRGYEELDSVREWKHLLPAGEYESLYGDDSNGLLYLLCKNCPNDNLKDIVSGFVLQSGDSIYPVGKFEINVRDLKLIKRKVKTGFRPSALAKSTVTNDWYILSAVNKMLVVTDSTWKIKEVCALDGKVFNQPEGISFDSTGNMYISNEGDDLTEGNILKFTRQSTQTNP